MERIRTNRCHVCGHQKSIGTLGLTYCPNQHGKKGDGNYQPPSIPK